MAYDMTNTLLDFFTLHLPAYANVGLDPDDPLYLNETILRPLQDDPTGRGYFLEMQPDSTLAADNIHWRTPVTAIKRGMLGVEQDFPMYVVGGGFLMINFFLLKGWNAFFDTKELAYEAGGSALRRIELAYAHIAHDILQQGVTTDDLHETTNVDYPQVFTLDGSHFTVNGGDGTWFTKIYSRFHIFSHIDRDYWLA